MAVSGVLPDAHAPRRKAALKLLGRPPIDRRHSSHSTCIHITVEPFISFSAAPITPAAAPVRLPYPRSATFNPIYHPPRLKVSPLNHSNHNNPSSHLTPSINSASFPLTASPVAPSSVPVKPAEQLQPQISGTPSTLPPTPLSSPLVLFHHH